MGGSKILSPAASRHGARLLVGTVALLAIPLHLLAQHAPGAVRSTSSIAASAAPAAVTILAVDAAGDTLRQGSGFLVRSNGVVITNWHVVEGASGAVLILSSGERFSRVEALDGDREADLAILKVPGYGLATLPTTGSIPPVGSRVVAVGSPEGLEQTVSEGIVSAHRLVRGRELVQISAAISPGSSGGPVLDVQGRVFAVTTSQLAEGQQLNFAVPVRYALGLLEAGKLPRPLGLVFGGAETDLNTDSRMSRDTAGPMWAAQRGEVDPRPAPAAQARPTVSGFYRLTEQGRWKDRSNPRFVTLHTGILALAGDNSGLALRWPLGDTADSSAWVSYVSRFNAAPDGRVAFKLAWVTFDGYQTGTGLFSEGATTDAAGQPLEVRLFLERVNPPLSEVGGLYTATARTAFYIGESRAPGVTDWSGDVVLLQARDSLFARVSLSNPSGGGSADFLRGPLAQDGGFRVQTEDGSAVIEGSVVAGVLRGNWIDRRDEGHRFEGPFKATRR